MATLPWATTKQAPEGEAAVVVLGSRLELRSARATVQFLRAALKVRKQVLGTDGAIGVSLIAQPLRRTYWTLSAWTNEDAIDAFVRTEPHAGVMRQFHDRLARAGFTTWPVRADTLPAARSNARDLWNTAREQLARKEGVHG